MKVLLINGSPRHGNTYKALTIAASALNENDIETEIFDIGAAGIRDCIGCRKCSELRKCIFDDAVNELVEKARTADGFIFGTPIHYSAPSSLLKAFMDRAFYSIKGAFAFKPAACISCARRAGTTAAFDDINKYFAISQMPIISSKYWNMVYGSKPEDVLRDEEGLAIMRALARNMAWFLKLKEAGDKMGIPLPIQEEPVKTNFIR